MRIGIDPGHGGIDPGAVGQAGTYESSNTLVISQKVVWFLQQAGLETIITRDQDMTLELSERVAILLDAGCDMVISIHINSYESESAQYVSVFIQQTGGESEKLANAINDQLKASVAWPNAGVKTANLYMTRKPNQVGIPACLCELGFMSNPYEEWRLQGEDIRNKFAAAIARGVTDYLTGVNH